MEVYLDNAATTKVFPAVSDIMTETMESAYGNPSSKHKKGLEAELYIKNAKDIIAKSLKVDTKEIIFTSGGTESNNMALIGAALANSRSGRHIITTNFEHPSVTNPLLLLKEEGFRVDFVHVDVFGKVKLQELLDLICEETILISIMYVNNEIGSVQEIKKISDAVKNKKNNILLHVDAIQAYGKYRIYPKRDRIDLLSVSGHKIHGSKGIGFLYIGNKVKVKPLIYGGGHQKGMRAGTENVPAIAGISKAVEECYRGFDDKIGHLYQLKIRFIRALSVFERISIHTMADTKELRHMDEALLMEKCRQTAPHIVSVGFADIKGEVLLHALEEKGIFVSSGSACASNHQKISESLQAIGVNKEYLDSTIRFSFCEYTTMDEINYTIEQLKEIVPMLRRFIKR